MFQPVPFIRTIGTYEGTKTLKRSVIVSKDDALCSERKVIFSLSNLLRSRESYSVSAHSWRGEEEATRNSGKSTFDPQTGPYQGEGRLAGCSPPSPLFHPSTAIANLSSGSVASVHFCFSLCSSELSSLGQWTESHHA